MNKTKDTLISSAAKGSHESEAAHAKTLLENSNLNAGSHSSFASANPLLSQAGILRDDPFWNEMMAAIRADREETNAAQS